MTRASILKQRLCWYSSSLACFDRFFFPQMTYWGWRSNHFWYTTPSVTRTPRCSLKSACWYLSFRSYKAYHNDSYVYGQIERQIDGQTDGWTDRRLQATIDLGRIGWGVKIYTPTYWIGTRTWPYKGLSFIKLKILPTHSVETSQGGAWIPYDIKAASYHQITPTRLCQDHINSSASHWSWPINIENLSRKL